MKKHAMSVAWAIGIGLTGYLIGRYTSPVPATDRSTIATSQPAASILSNPGLLDTVPSSGSKVVSDGEIVGPAPLRTDTEAKQASAAVNHASLVDDAQLAADLDLSDAEEKERELVAQATAIMDTTLRAQSLDMVASQQLSDQLGASLLPTGSTVADVRCGRTLCRLEVAAAKPGTEQQMLMEIAQLPGFANTEGFHHRTSGEALVVYIARSGFRLPKG